MLKYLNVRPILALGLIVAFLVNSLGLIPVAQANEFRLPAPGIMVPLSPDFNPPILKGLKVHPDNPFRFDFILDRGDTPTRGHGFSRVPKVLKPDTRSYSQVAKQESAENESDPEEQSNAVELKQEAAKLIKYFLASLTTPENDLWVNLSPYEKNRIIPQSFGRTEMGRDLLAEDYMLKQITASLIYPEGETGKRFWKRIYEQAAQRFHTTNIPVTTFNKVWIVPDKAVVYENVKAGTVYVVEAKLKVMLEQDYLSLEKHQRQLSQRQPGNMFKSELQRTAKRCPHAGCPPSEALNLKAPQVNPFTQNENVNALGYQVLREIIIPALTKEVNEGKNFSQLRQVYNSLILATWYKKKIKDSILEQVYADKNKIRGIVIPAKAGIQNNVEFIYQQYLKAFKKGTYNYIKEEIDPATQQFIPRKYFSGGFSFTGRDWAMITTDHLSDAAMKSSSKEGLVQVETKLINDSAMFAILNRMPKTRREDSPFKQKATLRGIDINEVFMEVEQFAQFQGIDLGESLTSKREEIIRGLQHLIDNLAHHEYPSLNTPVYYRIYRSSDPSDGVRLEFWGPGKERFPKELLDKPSRGKRFIWFDAHDPPWQGVFPKYAFQTSTMHIGLSTMITHFGQFVKVGWRKGYNGHVIAVHFLANSDQVMIGNVNRAMQSESTEDPEVRADFVHLTRLTDYWKAYEFISYSQREVGFLNKVVRESKYPWDILMALQARKFMLEGDKSNEDLINLFNDESTNEDRREYLKKILILNQELDRYIEEIGKSDTPAYLDDRYKNTIDYIPKFIFILNHMLESDQKIIFTQRLYGILHQIEELKHPLTVALPALQDWFAYAVMEYSSNYIKRIKGLVRLAKAGHPFACALLFSMNGPHTRVEGDKEDIPAQKDLISGFGPYLREGLNWLENHKNSEHTAEYKRKRTYYRKYAAHLINGVLLQPNTLTHNLDIIGEGLLGGYDELIKLLKDSIEMYPEIFHKDSVPFYLFFEGDTYGDYLINRVAYYDGKTGMHVTDRDILSGTPSRKAQEFMAQMSEEARETYRSQGALSKADISKRYFELLSLLQILPPEHLLENEDENLAMGIKLDKAEILLIDPSFDQWVEEGGMTDLDKQLYTQILSGEEKTLYDILKQYPDKVAISLLDAQYPENGRTVYLTLDHPFPTSQGNITILRMKGVRPRLMEGSQNLVEHTGDGTRSQVLNLDNNGNIILNENDNPAPQGVMREPNMKMESQVMKDSFGKTFKTDYFIANGLWKDIKYKGGRVGYVVVGMRQADVRLVGATWDPDFHGKLINMVSGVALDLNSGLKKEIFRQVGASIRAYHDEGYFHRSPHLGNWGVEILDGNHVKVVMRDLGDTIRHLSFKGPDLRRIEAGYRFLDVQRIIAGITRNGYAAKAQSEPFLRSFLEGYFPEIKNDEPAEFEELYKGCDLPEFSDSRVSLIYLGTKLELNADTRIYGDLWKHLYNLTADSAMKTELTDQAMKVVVENDHVEMSHQAEFFQLSERAAPQEVFKITFAGLLQFENRWKDTYDWGDTEGHLFKDSFQARQDYLLFFSLVYELTHNAGFYDIPRFNDNHYPIDVTCLAYPLIDGSAIVRIEIHQISIGESDWGRIIKNAKGEREAYSGNNRAFNAVRNLALTQRPFQLEYTRGKALGPGEKRDLTTTLWIKVDRMLETQPLAEHPGPIKVDRAMDAKVVRGGIDFTSAKMNLQTNRDGIIFHISPAMLAELQRATEFIPAIVDIQPLKSLHAFLDK